MADARAWAWFGGGLASGLGLLGLYHWKYARKLPLGRIYQIGDRYYADSAVVDELVRRVPGSKRVGTAGAHIYLYRRGKLTFESDLPYGKLPGQVGEHVLRMYAADTPVEDLAIELIRFGLALPGGAFPTWPAEGPRGTWTPPAAPLHPSALDPRRQAALAEAPLKERPRPIGHYFQVGQNFYADEPFLQTLEGFHGADFVGRTTVPLWRRGHLELYPQTSAKMLPEQVRDLYLIESHLTGVSLADLLLELESLGLVSWGGVWPTFPARLAGYVPTGPLLLRTSGRVFSDRGHYYLDDAARRRLLSRLPRDEDRVLWRGQAFALPEAFITPREGGGMLYLVTPWEGQPGDERVRTFVDELVLHHIARPAEFRADDKGPREEATR